MQSSNLIIMPNRNANQNPEGLNTVWRAVHKLEQDLRRIIIPEKKVSIWAWMWAERSWLIPTTLVVFGFVLTGAWYLGGLIVDRHLQNALIPIQQTVTGLDGKIQGIDGRLSILQAQIATIKYSAVPEQELKNHRAELTSMKASLATAPRAAPYFWPTSFQVLTLLSKATSPVQRRHASLDLTDVSGIGSRTISYPPGSVINLHGLIKDSTFTEAVIYLDANVVLRNVTFINCTLILPEIQTPSTPLEAIGNQLLSASDLSRVTITGT